MDVYRKIETLLKKYVKAEQTRQSYLIDLLLVHVGIRPAFYFEDQKLYTNATFMKRIQSIGGDWKVEIGGFYDSTATVCVFIHTSAYPRVIKLLRELEPMSGLDPLKHVKISQVLGYPCIGYPGDYLQNKPVLMYSIVIECTSRLKGTTTQHLGCFFVSESQPQVVADTIQKLLELKKQPVFQPFSCSIKIDIDR
jgi:hypothetical protein